MLMLADASLRCFVDLADWDGVRRWYGRFA